MRHLRTTPCCTTFRTSPSVKEPPRDGSPCSPARATAPRSCGSAGSCRTCASTKAETLDGWAEQPGAPSSGSTIPATDNRAESSRTARFPIGSRMHWRFWRIRALAPCPGRLLHGRMDLPPGHAGAPENGSRAGTGRDRPDRARGRFHGTAHVGPVSGGDQAHHRGGRRVPPAFALFGHPLPDHPRASSRTAVGTFCSESRSQRAARCTSSKE